MSESSLDTILEEPGTRDAAGHAIYEQADVPICSYDEVPYTTHAYRQTHPDQLAVVARLFGLNPSPVGSCRILELGCARGGNLVPMAEQLPESRFVGIDLSQVQIAEAQSFARQVGLDNIELKQLNILDVDRDFGEFDYIICHGIFSWVPLEVQTKILDICANNLAPDGVAYVSYNTYPGWHMRGMIRDMMLYHTARFDDAKTRIEQARALLAFLAENAPEQTAFGRLLKTELEALHGQPDNYIYHDHLEEINDPIYFHQFAERAEAAGLAYLGEAGMSAMWTGHLTPEVSKTLDRVASDLVQMEQYMDFTRNRTFRQTLLCHRGQPIDRELTPDSLDALLVSALLLPDESTFNLHSTEPTVFRHAHSQLNLTTSLPLVKAAMIHLAQSWPAPVPFPKLLDAARRHVSHDLLVGAEQIAQDRESLGKLLLECYVSELVELHSHAPRFTTKISERPVASRVARAQAESGANHLTNLRHDSGPAVELPGHVLRHLDGTRDRNALLDILADLVERGVLVLQEDAEAATTDQSPRERIALELDRTFIYLAQNALLLE